MKTFISVLIFISFLFISISAHVNEKLLKGDSYLNKFDLHNTAKHYELAYKEDPRNYFVLLRLPEFIMILGKIIMKNVMTKL